MRFSTFLIKFRIFLSFFFAALLAQTSSSTVTPPPPPPPPQKLNFHYVLRSGTHVQMKCHDWHWLCLCTLETFMRIICINFLINVVVVVIAFEIPIWEWAMCSDGPWIEFETVWFILFRVVRHGESVKRIWLRFVHRSDFRLIDCPIVLSVFFFFLNIFSSFSRIRKYRMVFARWLGSTFGVLPSLLPSSLHNKMLYDARAIFFTFRRSHSHRVAYTAYTPLSSKTHWMAFFIWFALWVCVCVCAFSAIDQIELCIACTLSFQLLIMMIQPNRHNT